METVPPDISSTLVNVTGDIFKVILLFLRY